jgi:hypothetical protein
MTGQQKGDLLIQVTTEFNNAMKLHSGIVILQVY